MRRHYGERFPNELRILDLGSGDASLICRLTAALKSSGTSVKAIGCELSSSALAKTRLEPHPNVGGFVQADSAQLPFCGQVFDGVTSFGYGSVASYDNPQIHQEVFRALKPGGWLIVDYRNHLSLWFIVLKPWLIAKWLMRFWGFQKPQYHFATFGIRRYYTRCSFEPRIVRFLLCFPPVSFSERYLLAIERVCRLLRVERLFGRIFLGLFHRKKQYVNPQGI